MADQIDYCWEDILPDGKLPGDVMVSILTNLPVKSLLKFKAVCKRWHSLISSPLFIKMHLHRQSVIANMLLLSWENIETDLTDLALLSHSDTKTPADCDISTSELLPSLSSLEEDVYAVDSCKGLVCLRQSVRGQGSSDSRHILWNPATRKYWFIELPKKPCFTAFKMLGLGYVEATNDYKILGLADSGPSSNDDKCMFVYTLSSDSWKELDYDAKSFEEWIKPPTFINGCIHWLLNSCTCSSNVEKIFAFDVEDEVMCCFGIPDPGSTISGQTLVIRGCLSIVISSRESHSEVLEGGIEIWVMVEYGVEGSWVKLFTIQGLTTTEMPLRSWKDNEILFVYQEEEDGLEKLMLYDPCSKKMIKLRHAPFFTDSCKVFNYVESLASVIGGRNCSIQPGLI